MNHKETFGKIGFFIITFLLLIFFIEAQGSGNWATLQAVDSSLANQRSLELLWTTLVTATLIQGFMLYSALLGANSQFTPPTKKVNNKEEHS
ncbi:hypothetical protein CEE45_12030 [Candidatus Heimdallarchaeota archaeon B3_Heim]|nr:MAG: hypothetical protein CEE45_12030 [Candidatus Heimdallarchaeota archaeon B3_Heim]